MRTIELMVSSADQPLLMNIKPQTAANTKAPASFIHKGRMQKETRRNKRRKFWNGGFRKDVCKAMAAAASILPDGEYGAAQETVSARNSALLTPYSVYGKPPHAPLEE